MEKTDRQNSGGVHERILDPECWCAIEELDQVI